MTSAVVIPATKRERPSSTLRAVAYYRSSAEGDNEQSIAIQRDRVRRWAAENGVEIIHEFADAGKSGLNAEDRPAFNDLMDNWVSQRNDFHYVLCLDVSRWGRFQDIDLSAQYSAICKKHNKLVIYTTIGKPRENDPLYPVYVQFERFRDAQYSKELSDKVWRGCVKISEQGYWPGGSPPYGLRRLLLDEKREPLHVLDPGQRKGIQNQRVTLVEGDADEVIVIRRIFHEFVELLHSEYRIAEGLNTDGIVSPGGRRWGAGGVLGRLRNEAYVGTLIYNRTSQKLKTPSRPNPPDAWIRTPEAFGAIVSPEQFTRAQEILEERRHKYDPDRLLGQLDTLYKQYGVFRSTLLRTDDDFASPSTYAHHFGSLDLAFQQLYREQREKARAVVHDQIRQHVGDVLAYADFLVLDQKLALAVEPAVPVSSGYSAYWPIRPDHRHVIDITLGVLLADSHDLDILGYVALPRWLAGRNTMRVSATSTRTELFGCNDLAFLQTLL